MTTSDTDDDGYARPGGAQDLLLYGYSEDCAATVARRLTRLKLPVSGGLAIDAEIAVMANIESHVARNPGQVYDDVRKYGRTIAINTVNRIARGGTAVVDLDVEHVADQPQAVRPDLLDSVRFHLEELCSKAWLLAASLAFVTLAAHPETLPPDAPQPQAGATPDQARGWAAIWLAGVRNAFPEAGSDTRRRQRNNKVRATVDVAKKAAAAAGEHEV